jgi:large subunit ribosomal protein L18
MGYQKVKYRRRREGKTDYKARLALLKSGLPRIVVRKTNCYIIMQLVISKEAQDYVIASANSKELLSYGWPPHLRGSLKSIPAAYLTGFLLYSKIKGRESSKQIKKVILDAGLNRSTKGSRIYAAIKGLKDCGFDIACSDEMFPDAERINAKHMKREIPVEEIKNNLLKR